MGDACMMCILTGHVDRYHWRVYNVSKYDCCWYGGRSLFAGEHSEPRDKRRLSLQHPVALVTGALEWGKCLTGDPRPQGYRPSCQLLYLTGTTPHKAAFDVCLASSVPGHPRSPPPPPPPPRPPLFHWVHHQSARLLRPTLLRPQHAPTMVRRCCPCAICPRALGTSPLDRKR